MVRNIVGVLLAIGAGEADPGWAGEVLRRKDRTQGGVTAPAGGLYFTGVEFPATYGLNAGGLPVF
jgi:tRNA pseudouridine38-40 synthase